MNARLSMLLSCALLGACGRPDVDSPGTPTAQGQQAAQEQQSAQEQQWAQEQQSAREQQAAREQPPAPEQPPTQEQRPAQAQQPPPPPSDPGTAASPQPATEAPTTPAPATAAGEPMFSPTPATVVRETELKAQPSLDAQTLATLPVQTAVTIVDRREGWFEVVHEGTHGWVRLLHVSSQPPGTHGPIPPELERAARVATGRAGGGNVVVTTGTRGLTEEELREAEANPEELRRMEALAADRAQAETYAREHGLERRSVPYPSEAGGAAR